MLFNFIKSVLFKSILSKNNNNKKMISYKILSKVKGVDDDKSNDVIIFPALKTTNYNVLFFHGDVQDYPEEMLKHPINKTYVEWNLINTGNILCKRMNANVFVIKADKMHLKTFANYSNFVKSNDFGTPNSSNNNGSNSNNTCSVINDLNALKHLHKLYENSINEYNKTTTATNIDFNDSKLILCGFSKGCVCINQLCNELAASAASSGNQINDENFKMFLNQIKHIIWLDGGHCGNSNAWLTHTNTIENLVKINKINLYVYVTPYQIGERNQKKWAIKEYKIFSEILNKVAVDKFKQKCYSDNIDIAYQNGEDTECNLNTHFNLLNVFDTSLIDD